MTIGVNVRAFCTSCDHQRLHKFRDLFRRLAGLILQHACFVIVYRHVVCHADEVHQFFAGKHRHSLARIKHKRNARFSKFLCVLQHCIASIGRDDAEFDVTRIGHMVDLGGIHRAGVKGGNLVVVKVSGDECLCGKCLRDNRHMPRLKTE